MTGSTIIRRLHGRRDECDALERVLGRAEAGQGSVLVLRGESGVGKTALLDPMWPRSDLLPA